MTFKSNLLITFKHYAMEKYDTLRVTIQEHKIGMVAFEGNCLCEHYVFI